MCPEAVFFVCEYCNKLLQNLKKEKKYQSNDFDRFYSLEARCSI